MARTAIVLFVVAVGIVAFAPAASAHATLETTSPAAGDVIDAAPSAVEMIFSEPVTAVAGAVRVLGPDGARVDDSVPRSTASGRGVSVAINSPGQGTHTVSWRVTSDDGHTISGSWVFHVGVKTGAVGSDDSGVRGGVGAASWGGRFLFYAGFIVAVGTLAFGWWTNDDRRALRSLMRWAAVAAVGGALLIFIARAAEVTGTTLWGAPARLGDLAATRATRLDLVRVGLSVTLAVVATLRQRMVRLAAGAATAVALAVVVSVSGHASVVSPTGVTLVSDSVHLLAAAVWVGGLTAFAVAARTEADVDAVGRRFSTLAGIALAAVVACGSVSGWAQLGSPAALWDTAYGRVLVAKVSLVAAMAAMGWLNRKRLAVGAQLGGVLRSVRLEVIAGVLVVGLTASLVAMVPGRDAVARPFSGSVPLGSGSVVVDVAPAKVGANEMHLNFVDANGIAMRVDAAEVTISTSSIEPRRVAVVPITASHYTAPDVAFGAPGDWTVEVVAVVAGESSQAALRVPVR